MDRLFSRLNSAMRLVNSDGTPSRAFGLYHQKHCEALEKQISALQDQVAAIVAAQATADAAKQNDAIGSSFTKPGLVATAAAGGSSVTITIANHDRFYGDSTSAAVLGAPLSGIPFSASSSTPDKVAIYYDDPGREGGTVTYHHTTDLLVAQNNYVSGRHYVATLEIPVSGGAPTSGGTAPSGSGYRTFSSADGTSLP
jgi:hypothetical protein